ncbi:MAG TPA: class I SAM-dependent methyltransferase [Alphaproteobacteria bacterium]
MPPPDDKSTDYKSRLLAQYVSTHASVGDAVAGLERRRPYLDRLVREHFPPDRSAAVLDLGCGHGAVLWAARRAGYTSLAGVDASPEQVAAAASLGITGVRQGDLKAALAATPDASQDVVVLFDLFHYFPPDAQFALADEVRRVLKPGGRWILHVPNGEALFGARMRYWDYLAGGAFTRASIGQVLRACGFAEVRCFEDVPAVHGAASAARWLAWKLVRGLARFLLAAETGETGRDAIFSQCLLAVAIK